MTHFPTSNPKMTSTRGRCLARGFDPLMKASILSLTLETSSRSDIFNAWRNTAEENKVGCTANEKSWGQKKKKQGRIHGYPSRVQVGRGHNWGHQIIWAGAVKPKIPKTQKKVKCDGPTDGRTDWRTDKAGCRFACTRQKILRTDRPTQTNGPTWQGVELRVRD